MENNIINSNYLDLDKFKEKFHNNKPYPHIVIDNFLSKEFFSEIEMDTNKIDHKNGKKFLTDLEKNKWISKNTFLPKKIKLIIDELNKDYWIENLSKLSKINNVFSTQVGNTELANYHEMENDGYLGPHVDHSDDPDTGNPHVLNFLLYLSKEWDEKWGGSTLLYNDKGKKILNEIKYVPNRAIIFLHTPYSFHGVKKIVNNKNKRLSIYVDYYSSSKDPYKNIDLIFKKKWFKHGTYFVLPRTSDYFKYKNYSYIKNFIGYNLKRLLFG